MTSGAAERDRNIATPADEAAAITRQHAKFFAVEDKGGAAVGHVVGDRCNRRIEAEPDDFAFMGHRLFDQARVFRVEHQLAGLAHGVAQHPLDVEQLVEIARAEIAEMVLADVGNQGGVGLFDAESAT